MKYETNRQEGRLTLSAELYMFMDLVVPFFTLKTFIDNILTTLKYQFSHINVIYEEKSDHKIEKSQFFNF